MNTQDAFVHHMNSMREHHKAGATHLYALPVNLLHAGAQDSAGLIAESANDADGAADVTADLKSYEAETTTFVDGQKTSASVAVDTLKANKHPDDASTAAFKAAMEKQKAEAKKKADELIDKNYDKLINTGIKHPSQQKRILTSTQMIGAFFTNLLDSVGKFFENLGKSIVNFFKDVGKWFSDAGKAIANWTEGAAHSVGNFFSSLF